MTERVTLQPGDYVKTYGMTEDQYHAVARAFMAAGAAGGEYPNHSYADEEISCARWSFGNRRGALWHGLSGCFDGRHLTISQVLSATNAGNKVEDMTPCEKLGYRWGDRFVADGTTEFSDGSIVELYRDDGSSLPLWKLISGHCEYRKADKKPGAYAYVKYFEKIGESCTLTQTLRAASEHEAQAAQHRAKHDELMQQAREMLPDGWRLVKAEDMPDGPSLTIVDGQDMTDPANWREGDVVECIDERPQHCHKGGLYTVNESHLRFDGKLRIKADDDGDKGTPPLSSFRFHHRPNT